ncbi:MAG: S24/S26 family peptidase [Clostridia bacterium]|nr:S24/S26 family peptidase [Clostridia bacterium]
MKDETAVIAAQLRAGKTVVTSTRGVSMEPLLHEDKTLVTLQPVQRTLCVGELPIFLRNDGKYVIHRIIEVHDAYYRTRGDNCLSSETVPHTSVLGVVTEIYRNGSYLKVTDKKYLLYVWIWRITTPLRLMIFRGITWLKRIIRRIRQKKKKENNT